MNFADFQDPLLERAGKKAIYVDRALVREFKKFCIKNNKSSSSVAEYLINLGIHTPDNKKVSLDIENV
mgnify:CR=1 FL=1|jgi:hypothetical protein